MGSEPPAGQRCSAILYHLIPDQERNRSRMANIKSQIKRNRQNEVRRQRNKSTRSELRTQIKKVTEIAESDDRAAAEDAYKTAAKALDQAAAKGVIHRNAAANKKSRLARRLNPSN
jgi:small subunit ribosomal protein S20